ncbi:hypothetical protein CDAR_552761 [Caerostris darwini]|uniref:Reverse transcriptase n=1 Tax=Caerostris darwini TaxID=1538125 RepID=A0AAV4M3J6_9ARAC|nr:hypothetical protein CDAR_552761 [Caerostris darwini]
MEKITVRRLNFYRETSRVLAEQQGLRGFRSNSQHVALLDQSVKDAVDNRQALTAVFIDLKSTYGNTCAFKHFAGIRWGCTEPTLLHTYHAFIRALLTYFCGPLFVAGGKYSLEKVKNSGLIYCFWGSNHQPDRRQAYDDW